MHICFHILGHLFWSTKWVKLRRPLLLCFHGMNCQPRSSLVILLGTDSLHGLCHGCNELILPILSIGSSSKWLNVKLVSAYIDMNLHKPIWNSEVSWVSLLNPTSCNCFNNLALEAPPRAHCSWISGVTCSFPLGFFSQIRLRRASAASDVSGISLVVLDLGLWRLGFPFIRLPSLIWIPPSISVGVWLIHHRTWFRSLSSGRCIGTPVTLCLGGRQLVWLGSKVLLTELGQIELQSFVGLCNSASYWLQNPKQVWTGQALYH